MDTATTTTQAATRRTRVFRRYVNRKFYDPEGSRYVNLEEIAKAIRSGEDVQVLEVPTRRDLTGSILAWILSGEERRAARTSAQELTELIRRRAAEAACARPPAPVLEEPARAPAPPSAEQIANALLSRGQRLAFAARERLDCALASLDRLDGAARGRVDGAAEVVRGIEQVRDRLARATRRIDELHEELRRLERA
jgi:hypothetical protein